MFSGGIYSVPVLSNNAFLQGLSTAPAAVNLIGVNAANLVSIDPQGVGVTIGGQVKLAGAGGLTIEGGSVGAGHGRTDAQIEIDNRLGGHALLSIYQKFSASEEGGISFEANLSNAAAAQVASMFSVFVNDVNTFNNYKAALGFHLPDSVADTSPLILFSNNSAKLVPGLTSAATWDTAPAINSLEIGRTANVVSVFVNTTDLVLDRTKFGSVGAFGVGAVAATSSYFNVDNPALTGGAGTNVFRFSITNSNAITIGTGTSAVVASMLLNEPNITLGGNTVTVAATLYIADAPTEGGSNAALWVNAGSVSVPSIATRSTTVAGLASLSAQKGNRAFVSDSNAASFTAGIGAIVAGGGATNVPVVSDGTNWRIG